MRKYFEDRLSSRIEVTGFCWLYVKNLNKDGYGTWNAPGKHWRAHRLMYELLVGPIPEGLVLDHLCRVRNCVNPDHLEPVTRAENHSRAFTLSKRVLCPQGHKYTPENTKINTKGARYCSECARIKGRARLDAQYAAEGRTPEVFGTERTHCRKGHSYALDGYYSQKNVSGGISRVCKPCFKVTTEKYRAKRIKETA